MTFLSSSNSLFGLLRKNCLSKYLISLRQHITFSKLAYVHHQQKNIIQDMVKICSLNHKVILRSLKIHDHCAVTLCVKQFHTQACSLSSYRDDNSQDDSDDNEETDSDEEENDYEDEEGIYNVVNEMEGYFIFVFIFIVIVPLTDIKVLQNYFFKC